MGYPDSLVSKTDFLKAAIDITKAVGSASATPDPVNAFPQLLENLYKKIVELMEEADKI